MLTTVRDRVSIAIILYSDLPRTLVLTTGCCMLCRFYNLTTDCYSSAWSRECRMQNLELQLKIFSDWIRSFHLQVVILVLELLLPSRPGFVAVPTPAMFLSTAAVIISIFSPYSCYCCYSYLKLAYSYPAHHCNIPGRRFAVFVAAADSHY